MTYNGWENRETWLIGLWFEYQTREELDDIQMMIEEDLEELRMKVPEYMVDLLGINFIMDEINWEELQGHCESMEGLTDE